MKKYISCFLLFNIYIKSNSLIVDIDNNEWLPFVGDVSNKFYKYLNVSATFSGRFPFDGDLVFSLGVKKSFYYNMFTVGLQNHVGGITTDGNAIILPSLLPRGFVRVSYFSDMLNSNINFKYSCLYNCEKKECVHSVQLYLNFDEINNAFGVKKDAEHKLYKTYSKSLTKTNLEEELINLVSKDNSGFQICHMKQLLFALNVSCSEDLEIPTGIRILLYGESGSGKTYICENIGKILKKYKQNICFLDLFGMNTGGYTGKTLEEVFTHFFDNCQDKSRFEYGTFIMDEIDKVAASDLQLRAELLDSLLTLLNSNGNITIRGKSFSTKKMSFIFPASFTSIINYVEAKKIIKESITNNSHINEISSFLLEMKSKIKDTKLHKSIDNLHLALDSNYSYLSFLDERENLNKITQNYSEIFNYLQKEYIKNKQLKTINKYVETAYEKINKMEVKFNIPKNEVDNRDILTRIFSATKSLNNSDHEQNIKKNGKLRSDFLNRVTMVEMKMAKIQIDTILDSFEKFTKQMKVSELNIKLNKELLKIFILTGDFEEGRVFEKLVKDFSGKLISQNSLKMLNILSERYDSPEIIDSFSFNYVDCLGEDAINLFLEHINLLSKKDENILSEFLKKQRKLVKFIKMEELINESNKIYPDSIKETISNFKKNIKSLSDSICNLEINLENNEEIQIFESLTNDDYLNKESTFYEIVSSLKFSKWIEDNIKEDVKENFKKSMQYELSDSLKNNLQESFLILRHQYIKDIKDKLMKCSKELLEMFDFNEILLSDTDISDIDNAKKNVTIEKCAEFVKMFDKDFEVILTDQLNELIKSSISEEQKVEE